MSEVAAAGWKDGWWTGAVFGLLWLAVIGVHSSRSPAVMAHTMTLSAFSLPSIMCVRVCVCMEAHTFRQHKTGDGDTDNVRRGCGSGKPSVTISGHSNSLDHDIAIKSAVMAKVMCSEDF